MATLASERLPTSPSFHRRRKSWARRFERCCCQAISYFPLAFVYGLTTWAVWVEVSIGFSPGAGKWAGPGTSILGIVLYALADISYTTAVFTDPGSPLNGSSRTTNAGYTSLPTHEPHPSTATTYTSLTAKSDGKRRYCKKCQAVKPDRAHHCSSCNRCVLKMDHHCPWLATCVGMYNYKAFLLFLVYTSLFCWVCFAVTLQWVWGEILDESQMEEGLMVVNTIVLAVLSGIIGLVLSGFTGWHIYLATSGQTTIESLEKTRYLSPLKKSMEHQIQRERHFVGDDTHEPSIGDQLKEIHANVLPGVTRPEEGEESATPPHPGQPAHFDSPASQSLRRTYASMEADRERERYATYLDEQDSEKLPHAFDLGWRRNLLHLAGDNPWLWPLPICNTSGDGWNWEVSRKWIAKRDEVARDREARDAEGLRDWQRQQVDWAREAGSGFATPVGAGAGRHYASPAYQQQWHQHRDPSWNTERDEDEEQGRYLTTTNGVASVPLSGRRSPSKADQILGRSTGTGRTPPPPPRRKVDDDGIDNYDTSSDEESDRKSRGPGPAQPTKATDNWNDIPEDFLASSRSRRERSTARTKGD
ncbi:hypothetical protein MBLNU459_g3316t1 [Dothideomycetes sp. NU459]